MVFITEERYRPNPISPTYPPYHSGLYMEEYFFYEWNRRNIQLDRQYIDIFWTNVFCNSMFAGQQYENLQQMLDGRLDPNGKYFVVSQFDDGPFERYPEDTLIFSAGGNRTEGNIIPIPLLCSPIPQYVIPQKEEKTIFASFVGSVNTHRVRARMYQTLSGTTDYVLNIGNWSTQIPIQNFVNFMDVTTSSKFALCPRGYGRNSFRMYEVMQLGAIPVYISDELYLPWSDELDWNEFCVVVKEEKIGDLDARLKSISDSDYQSMQNKLREVYPKYFTLNGMFNNILKRL